MQAKGDEVVITITWVHIAIAAVAVVVALALWSLAAPLLGPGMRLSTNRQEYRPGEEVVLEGWVTEGFLKPLASAPVVIEVRGGEELVWIDQVTTDGNGHFTSSFRLREDTRDGIYEAFANTEVAMGVARFTVRR
jgi:hypothetical protein